MSSLQVFVDSNVWFSAFYKPGVCRQLLNKLQHQATSEILISEQVIEEIIRNLQKKRPKALPSALDLIKDIFPTVIKNPTSKVLGKYPDLAEPKDLPILVAAIRHQCSYFVTGNLKHFQQKKIQKLHSVTVLTPAQMLKLINKQ